MLSKNRGKGTRTIYKDVWRFILYIEISLEIVREPAKKCTLLGGKGLRVLSLSPHSYEHIDMMPTPKE